MQGRTFAERMKTYLRLLSFAKPLGRFLTPFVLTSLVASVFGVLNFTLLIPLLSILFDKVDAQQMNALMSQPAPSITSSPTDAFSYYFARIFQQYGKLGALQFVCIIIVVSVALSNVFKYLSVRQLEAFKARMVARLREAVFSRTLGLHLGFFSNERKGNLMSRITSDVQEVENSIANTLSAASKEVFLLVGYVDCVAQYFGQADAFCHCGHSHFGRVYRYPRSADEARRAGRAAAAEQFGQPAR